MATISTNILPSMDLHTENQLHVFTMFRAIIEYWIAIHTINADIQFNMIVMMYDEGHTVSQIFNVDKIKHKDTKVV